MNILSLGSVEDIGGAIGRGDVKYLTAVAGLGKKTAERLVVELKGKIGARNEGTSVQGESGILGEVIDALESMGYSREEAKGAIDGMETAGKSTEEVLRMALRHMK
jgi:Holliday junction DNA helicase RuvA